MAYESTEARQMFPRLLQLVEMYPGSDVDAFIKKVECITSLYIMRCQRQIFFMC